MCDDVFGDNYGLVVELYFWLCVVDKCQLCLHIWDTMYPKAADIDCFCIVLSPYCGRNDFNIPICWWCQIYDC